jgi:hypothetical protein
MKREAPLVAWQEMSIVEVPLHEYGESLKARFSVYHGHPFNYSLGMDFKKVISEAAHS